MANQEIWIDSLLEAAATSHWDEPRVFLSSTFGSEEFGRHRSTIIKELTRLQLSPWFPDNRDGRGTGSGFVSIVPQCRSMVQKAQFEVVLIGNHRGSTPAEDEHTLDDDPEGEFLDEDHSYVEWEYFLGLQQQRSDRVFVLIPMMREELKNTSDIEDTAQRRFAEFVGSRREHSPAYFKMPQIVDRIVEEISAARNVFMKAFVEAAKCGSPDPVTSEGQQAGRLSAIMGVVLIVAAILFAFAGLGMFFFSVLQEESLRFMGPTIIFVGILTFVFLGLGALLLLRKV